MNSLYFGENLDILRDKIKDETIDLIYLDPPFNSKATYNVLFKTPKGHESPAQIEAFDDTWHWGEQAELEFNEIVHQGNTDVSEMMQALRQFLGENDMMAYLTMMANRLLELHRVLKPTGSLYLHCDPTASHYLKVVLDGVFGKENFRNEIIWKRTSAHSSAKRYGPVHDTILFYSRGDKFTWSPQYQPYDNDYIETFFDHVDNDGRRWKRENLTGAGTRKGVSGMPWRGIDVTAKGRHWAYVPKELDRLDKAGKIHWPKKKGGMPRFKKYLDEMSGAQLQDVWIDISPIHNLASERLGYPTQKPTSLLDRIILSSLNGDGIVLDPFCGCGTTVHAAQKLNRQWIGIDITHLAISLIEKRLNDAFPDIEYEVHGTPKDLDGAKDLAARDKYQFEWWACSLVNAQPYKGKKKGADSGIDGLIFFHDDKDKAKKIVVSVKGGENVSVSMIRDLKAVVDREKAQIGLFVTLAEPTKPMKQEATKAGFYTSESIQTNFPKIQILTIEELLNGIKPQYPSEKSWGGHTFKKAKKEDGEDDQKKLF